jgi:hypothetical protein
MMRFIISLANKSFDNMFQARYNHFTPKNKAFAPMRKLLPLYELAG